MEQLTRCNHCGLEWLVWFGEFPGEPDDVDWTCPACGSDDTVCV